MRRTRRRLLIAAAGVVALAAGILPVTVAQAMAQTPLAPTADYYGGGSRYLSGVVNSPEGTYNVSTNLWNPAVQGGFSMAWDNQISGFSVTNFSANSYFGTDPEVGPVPCSTNPGDTANFDPLDTGCDWAGHGDPWVNPNITTGNKRDQFASTGAMPAYVRPQAPNDGVNHVTGTSNEFSHQIHAPAAYPSIISGCHWGACAPSTTTPAGAPFPLQAGGVSRLDSVWTIAPPSATGPNEAWDAGYDIWFDSNCRPSPSDCAAQGSTLPSNPTLLNSPGQNDGAEIMIWINNQGYVNANPADAGRIDLYQAHAGRIQPAGIPLQVGVTIPGVKQTVPGMATPQDVTFDVWGGRVRSFDNGIRWNVISYVARIKGTGLVGNPPSSFNGGFDSYAFARHALSLDDMGIYCSTPTDRSATDPAKSPLDIEATACLQSQWWLTSVQAGFEIWNLPSTETIATTRFGVNPVAVGGGINTGGRTNPAGTPLVNWDDKFTITATGCANGTSPTWQIGPANNYFPVTTDSNGLWIPQSKKTLGPSPLTETPPGSGNYVATGVGPMRNEAAGYILHDDTTITISITCAGTTLTSTGNLFIDPSGRVLKTNGTPVDGATVTLLRSATQTGTFTAVPNNNAGLTQPVMSPRNTKNPFTTNTFGEYRWDVSPGWYKVRASKTGCTLPGSSQTFVESPARQVAANLPPILDLDLVMNCGETTGLPASVVVRPPGVRPISQGGYCADVYVTNNTSIPLEWNTTFTVPASQHINQKWNMVLTQSADNTTATAVHADPANPWNKILQPGQTTSSVGFCTGP